MNCANHPETPATAYCQQCGKPMCGECVRSVGGVINCEPCLAARLGVGLPGQTPPPFPPAHPNPVLAGLLGFIPGVGAMYNGQFVKALVHVLIFAVFVSLSNSSGIFGLFVAAWIFYQVFDAYQTARARRDGLPLPNPFGLNDLGPHLGFTGFTAPTPPAAGAPGTAAPPGPGGTAGPAGFSAAPASPGAPYAAPYPPPPGDPYAAAPPPLPAESRVPTGAIVLIVVGLFLLMETLGLVRAVWIGRSWPLLFVALGVWLAIRGRRPPRQGDPQ